MAKKEEAKKDDAAGFKMPDMSQVVDMAKKTLTFVQTHVMSLIDVCKKKCCAAKEAAEKKKAEEKD